MAPASTFTVDRDGERVELVPEFWPSELDADAERKYEGLRSLHVVEDGALSLPADSLPGLDLEPGDAVSLDAVWEARHRHLGSLGVGFFPAGSAGDRDRVASELLETHDDCRG